MEPIYLSIRQKETGSRIKSLLRESGYTVRDIQNAMGFENPQAVYKWISGKCLHFDQRRDHSRYPQSQTRDPRGRHRQRGRGCNF